MCVYDVTVYGIKLLPVISIHSKWRLTIFLKWFFPLLFGWTILLSQAWKIIHKTQYSRKNAPKSVPVAGCCISNYSRLSGLLYLAILWVRNSGKVGLGSLSLSCVASARDGRVHFQNGFLLTRLVVLRFLPLSPTRLPGISSSRDSPWIFGFSHGSLRAVTFLMWWLRAPRASIPRILHGAARLLMSAPECHFSHILWAK